MPKVLTERQVSSYENDGFLSPFTLCAPAEAAVLAIPWSATSRAAAPLVFCSLWSRCLTLGVPRQFAVVALVPRGVTARACRGCGAMHDLHQTRPPLRHPELEVGLEAG